MWRSSDTSYSLIHAKETGTINKSADFLTFRSTETKISSVWKPIDWQEVVTLLSNRCEVILSLQTQTFPFSVSLVGNCAYRYKQNCETRDISAEYTIKMAENFSDKWALLCRLIRGSLKMPEFCPDHESQLLNQSSGHKKMLTCVNLVTWIWSGQQKWPFFSF